MSEYVLYVGEKSKDSSTNQNTYFYFLLTNKIVANFEATQAKQEYLLANGFAVIYMLLIGTYIVLIGAYWCMQH